MLKNYFTTALRNFKKNKFYVFTNVMGLSIGISCCLVVFSILKHELTFDGWHQEKENVYRIVKHRMGDYGMTYSGILPNPMPEAIASSLAGLETMPLMGPVSGNIDFHFNERYQAFEESEILYADANFLQIMDFPILRGADASALDDLGKVFLTPEIAQKYFGDQEPIGQTINLNESTKLVVVGLVETPPTNTSTPFDMIISYQTRLEGNGEWMGNWGSDWSATCYVRIPDKDLQQVEAEINGIVANHVSEETMERTQYFLQPLKQVHTESKYGDAVNYVAPLEILAGFILLALITLIASILNFINLSTAQAVKRSKEIGIRKTLGSSRKQLVVQFLGETLFLVFLSTLLAFTIGQVFIDRMNEFLAEESFKIGYDFASVVFAAILLVVVTVMAGFYPAVLISGYNPIMAIKNEINVKKGSGNFWLRKGLVIGQFVIANLLIICTIIVASQMNYIRNKDLGFDPTNVVTMQFPDKVLDQMPIFKNEFGKESFVEKVSVSMNYPQGGSWGTSFTIPDVPYRDDMHARVLFIDDSFMDLYDIPMLSGRNVENQFYSDTTLQVLVSRNLIEVLDKNQNDILGTELSFMGGWKGKIVGVFEDFHQLTLQEKIRPTMMMYKPSYMRRLNLKLAQAPNPESMARMATLFRELSPTGYFECRVLREEMKDNYVVENLVFGVFQIFSALAILIAVFGLYGLVAFITNRNSKSISIKKVFGASPTQVLLSFGREFLILLLIAFAIASPLSYLLTGEWLNDFAYRIETSVLHFALGLIVTFLIMTLTIAHRSYKVATSNPVNALRYE